MGTRMPVVSETMPPSRSSVRFSREGSWLSDFVESLNGCRPAGLGGRGRSGWSPPALPGSRRLDGCCEAPRWFRPNEDERWLGEPELADRVPRSSRQVSKTRRPRRVRRTTSSQRCPRKPERAHDPRRAGTRSLRFIDVDRKVAPPGRHPVDSVHRRRLRSSPAGQVPGRCGQSTSIAKWESA